MIVIDVGCATYGGDTSVPYLLDTYRPSVLFGFDPGMSEETDTFNDFGSRVILRRVAAWTYDGETGFVVAGLGGHVDPGHGAIFPCEDLARFIREIETEEDIVLKMDAEGAEYVLLPHLVENDADLKLKLAIVEWHCEACGIGGNGRHREGCKMDTGWWQDRRTLVEGAMRCPMEEWNR